MCYYEWLTSSIIHLTVELVSFYMRFSKDSWVPVNTGRWESSQVSCMYSKSKYIFAILAVKCVMWADLDGFCKFKKEVQRYQQIVMTHMETNVTLFKMVEITQVILVWFAIHHETDLSPGNIKSSFWNDFGEHKILSLMNNVAGTSKWFSLLLS